MGAKKRIWITFGGGCIWDMVCLHDQAKKIAINPEKKLYEIFIDGRRMLFHWSWIFDR